MHSILSDKQRGGQSVAIARQADAITVRRCEGGAENNWLIITARDSLVGNWEVGETTSSDRWLGQNPLWKKQWPKNEISAAWRSPEATSDPSAQRLWEPSLEKHPTFENVFQFREFQNQPTDDSSLFRMHQIWWVAVDDKSFLDGLHTTVLDWCSRLLRHCETLVMSRARCGKIHFWSLWWLLLVQETPRSGYMQCRFCQIWWRTTDTTRWFK